jgi:hypothetical protein
MMIGEIIIPTLSIQGGSFLIFNENKIKGRALRKYVIAHPTVISAKR